MPETIGDGVFLQREFLAPLEMDAVLTALDRLSPCWAPSEALRALGRGRTDQVRGSDFVVQGALDQIRRLLTPPMLKWARGCGFKLTISPLVQIFPVRMMGATETPAYQEPHHDTREGSPYPPVCTNVFYARLEDIAGGGLAVTPEGRPDSTTPLVIAPAVNTVASFSGERVHWVEPLYAGERLSIVVNFY
jgi:hypothetical protein